MLVAIRRSIWVAALVGGLVTTAVAASAPYPWKTETSIRFAGDWETGDSSQWTWTQCSAAHSTSETGVLSVVTRPVGQGRFAARFDLPASRRTNACEVLRRRTLDAGTDDWYGLEVRLPRRWREPSRAGWGLAIAQLNYQGIWGPPVGVVARANRLELIVQSGLCNDVYSTRPGCAVSSGPGGNLPKMVVVPQPLARDRWHQLIVHVRWATGDAGLVEAWYRRRGGGKWLRSVSASGFPTVQWTAQRPPTYQGTVDKIGAYRGPAPFSLSIWYDRFVVGDSFKAVAAMLR